MHTINTYLSTILDNYQFTLAAISGFKAETIALGIQTRTIQTTNDAGKELRYNSSYL